MCSLRNKVTSFVVVGGGGGVGVGEQIRNTARCGEESEGRRVVVAVVVMWGKSPGDAVGVAHKEWRGGELDDNSDDEAAIIAG